MQSFRFFVLSSTIAAGTLAVTTPANAQSPSDKAAAQALFDDAQKLARSNDWAAACPKFAESNRLDPGIGVKLYLADCYERVGRTASAWEMFGEAEEYARKAGDNRASVAHDRAEKLAPHLIQLVIVAPAPAEGLVVRRDAVDVGSAQWGVSVPVDPGPHRIDASAPGKQPWTITVDAKEGTAAMRVEVPALADATPVATPAQVAAPSVDAAAPEPGKTQRILAVVATGVGVAGIAAGSILGLNAKSKLDDSNSGHCHDGNLCDAAGVDLRSQAKSDAVGSTILFAVGVAGIAGGAVLWFTSPRAAATVGVTPIVTERLAGLQVGGAF
jgi:serine/threonine-protein kinase